MFNCPKEQFFGTVCLCLASAEKMNSQRHAEDWLTSINGLLHLAAGTNYRPIGTPLVEFCGVWIPQTWIDEINTNQYWPLWHNKYNCPPSTSTFKGTT